ncbi:hypothetical protein KI659_12145 [Litoribacter alkaliphilus]|uniref:Cellulase family glycosylhydrolase n=1 Tax=Litoribacter ruber TaxID=702568 RepID=A0AAP2CHE9_9BACT|nr:hypothetical protein [Litoribacter alkaliphilus]MBS9524761.1 hypothetical protein [Litoribacter alkaliphilus]
MRLLLILLLLFPFGLMAQQISSTYLDESGVIRWSEDEAEVKGFGVNYTVPFAHAYRTAERWGVNQKEAIDNDLYHFTRLGFDLYRVHVWDTEISDSLGNLLGNEHLDHFDYLIHRLNELDINYVITPIAFWGNGWPEPNEDTPGFSEKYGKDECLTDPNCIKAQENYLTQFMNHTNPYTGVAYKDDPRLIAVEVSNEPHHRGEAAEVQKFVQGMVEAIRASGTEKPIFYNASHGTHFIEEYFEGGAQGGTFQWYPTGLGYKKEIPGNLLPNVNDYHIPFSEAFEKHHAGKLVYEFDAADVGRTYIYPVMARSFRTAGIQIGTHFSYDPTFMADVNTEYDTHYMNLAYTPGKAISLLISGEVFRKVPMRAEFGNYPQNLEFDDFTIDYHSDLALFNSGKKYFYTNAQEHEPKNISLLQQVAGVGNSPLIKYQGTGAYFLDRLDEDSWRLEVMPDAIWVEDPFGRNSPDKILAVINWASHSMRINLEGLGEDFSIKGINDGNTVDVTAEQKSFEIQPGTYVVQRAGSSKSWPADEDFGKGKLGDFYAPKATVEKSYLVHKSIESASLDQPLKIEVKYVAKEKPKAIKIQPGFRDPIALEEVKPYHYQAEIPADLLYEGLFEYHLIVKNKDGKNITYPAGKEGRPSDWDFYDREAYKVNITPAEYPIHLFDAKSDSEWLVRQWREGFRLVPTKHSTEFEYQMPIEQLFVEDPENLNAEPIYDYSFKHFILDAIKGRKNDLSSKNRLVLKGRSLEEKPLNLQVAFVLDDGSAYGCMVEIGAEMGEYTLDLNSVQPVKTVTLPRPYPSFLPYYFEHDLPEDFDITRVESLQFSIGPELDEDEKKASHGLGIISIRLE